MLFSSFLFCFCFTFLSRPWWQSKVFLLTIEYGNPVNWMCWSFHKIRYFFSKTSSNERNLQLHTTKTLLFFKIQIYYYLIYLCVQILLLSNKLKTLKYVRFHELWWSHLLLQYCSPNILLMNFHCLLLQGNKIIK